MLILGSITYVSMHQNTNQKIENGINNSLSQVRSNLEAILSNMDYASLQLSSEGIIGELLDGMLSTQDRYEEFAFKQDIQKYLNLINYTNPYIGVILYYIPQSRTVMFENFRVVDDFGLDLPLLTLDNGAQYFGPHQTAYKNSKNMVFSLVRPVDVPGSPEDKKIYIYIETNLKLFEDIIRKKQYGMNASHILINSDGKIAYSDDTDLFKPGTQYDTERLPDIEKSYYLFDTESQQGWSLVVAIAKAEFEKEFRDWLFRYGLIVLASLCVSGLLAVVIWKSVYLPLKSEIEQRERAKRQLEVEMLLHQINPHFIHNTLNTIQWIAKINGQAEIDKLVTIFTRVLYYNLSNQGEQVHLEDEVKALKDYIELQRIRYDYDFAVIFQVDERFLKFQIPRFIIQPLVENAFYHGLDEGDGLITVRILPDGDHYLLIEVEDDGKGILPEEIARLLQGEKDPNRKAGLGIGLNYVRRVLQSNFGQHSRFDIESEIGKGTVIRIRIPLISQRLK